CFELKAVLIALYSSRVGSYDTFSSSTAVAVDAANTTMAKAWARVLLCDMESSPSAPRVMRASGRPPRACLQREEPSWYRTGRGGSAARRGGDYAATRSGRQRSPRDGPCSAATAAAWRARAASLRARGLSERERRCRFVLSHRVCSCFVVIARLLSVLCRRPGWRLRTTKKARVAGAARALVHSGSSRIRTSQRRARCDRSHGWPPGPRYNNTRSRTLSSRASTCPIDTGMSRAFDLCPLQVGALVARCRACVISDPSASP